MNLRNSIKLLYQRLHHQTKTPEFPGSATYWERRYAIGGNSGVGSYGLLADFKARIINQIISQYQIDKVIEFGCGDGNQIRYFNIPHYIGFDVSVTAIMRCRELYTTDETKKFYPLIEYSGQRAKLTLSLDVLYHLVEDAIFKSYMHTLFSASDHYVLVYSTDFEGDRATPHVRHRQFTEWVRVEQPHWNLIKHIPNEHPFNNDISLGSSADFFLYKRTL